MTKRINLLPKIKQTELANEKLFYSVAVAIALSTAVLLLAVVVQGGVYAYLNNKVSSVNDQIEQLKKLANKSENADVKTQIKLANAQINDFAALYANTPKWAGVVGSVLNHVPDKVKITQFDADSTTGIVTITGYAPTRDLVIDLYNNINSDKTNFKDINYPLENVTQPTNVRFYFNFSVADNVLAKGVK